MKKSKVILLVLIPVVALLALWRSTLQKAAAVSIEGQRDTVLSLVIDVAGLVQEIESRIPAEKQQDPKLQTGLNLVKQLGITKVEFYLHRKEGKPITPILVVPDPELRIRDELLANPFVGPFLTQTPEQGLQLKQAALPDTGSIPLEHRNLSIRYVSKRLVCSTPEILSDLEQGTLDLGQSFVSSLAGRATTPQTLVTLAVVVPQEIHTDWKERLQEHEALKNNMIAAIIAGTAIDLLEEVSALLKTTQGIAIGFAFEGHDGRTLSYAQYFDSPGTASRVAATLKRGEAPGDDVDGFVLNILDVLENKSLNQRINAQGNLLTAELSWTVAADAEIGQQLAEATIGYVLSKGMAGGMEPTAGPVEAHYTQNPKLQESVNPQALEQSLARQLKQIIFPGWFFSSGEEPHMSLEVDTPWIPNAALSEAEYEVLSVLTGDGQQVLRSQTTQFSNRLDFSSGSMNHIRVPVLEGVGEGALAVARVQIKMTVPTALAVFTFSADDGDGTLRKQGKLSVKLEQLERDVASVRCRGSRGGLFVFAWDRTGRALSRRSSMSSGSSATVRFRGVIQKLQVVIPRQMHTINRTVEVDLNGGKPLQLPKTPSATVPTRFEPSSQKDYRSIGAEDLADLEVRWIQDAANIWESGLTLSLPQGVSDVIHAWELHWFDGERPMMIGGGGMSQGSKLIWRRNNQEGLEKVAAVFGWLSVKVPTSIKSMTVQKQTNGTWISQLLDAKQQLKVRFDHNEVTYSAGDARILAVSAFDKAGSRLKIDHRSSGDKLGTHCYFWGQPSRVELVISLKTIEQKFPVDIEQRSLNTQALAEYKKQVENERAIARALRTIEQAMKKNWKGYGEDIAGLYYLHGKRGRPGQHIPVEYAHACPQGADRFGYALEPFNGYTFSFFEFTEQDGERTTHRRRNKVRDYTWDGGSIRLNPFYQRPGLVARPVDPSQPTFYISWRTLYMKQLPEGERLEAKPRTPWDEGWVQVEYVE